MKRFFLSLIFLSILSGLFWFARAIHFENYEWLPESNPNEQARQYLSDEYKPGEDLVVAIELSKDYFDQDIIQSFYDLSTKIEEDPLVLEINTPLHATVILGDQNTLETETYWDALEKGHLSDLEAYRDHLKNSHYFGQLISKDFTHISMLIRLDIHAGDFNFFKREAIISKVEALLKETSYFNVFYLSGEAQLTHQMDVSTQDNLERLLKVSILIILFFLYIIFRNIFKLLIIATSATAAVLSAFMIINLLGHPITAVSLILPIVIIVIAIADSIHILTRWDVLRNTIEDKVDCLKETIRETWLPCLMTSVTTGIGFGAFYFSELIPLQYFGTDAFILVLFAYLIIVSFSWGGIYIFSQPLHRSDSMPTYRYLSVILNHLYDWTQQFWKPILVVTCLFVLGFGFMLKNVYTESNFLDVFFKKDSSLYQSFTYVDYHLGGSGNVDLLLKTDQKDYFKDHDVMQKIRAFEKEVVKHPWVNYTQSYLNPVSMLHKELAEGESYPKDTEQLSQELLFLEFSRGDKDKDVLSSYIDFDYQNARIHLQTPNLNAQDTGQLMGYLSQLLRDLSFPGTVYTGSSVFFQVLSGYILETQILSVFVTLGVIWLIFCLTFGPKIGSIGMIPNIVPIVLTTGLIATLKIPFDFATVLISSISFGICVDDSIHFIHYYKCGKDQGLSFEERTRRTVRVLGYPLIFTTILLSLGFGIFVISDLVILLKFGAFTVFAIIVALISDLVILPSAFRLFDSKS